MVKNATKPAAQPEATAYAGNENDLIDDILMRVIALTPGFSAAVAAQVAAETRDRWGGDRVYIQRKGDTISTRNASIKRDYLAGERIPLLERRYGLCKARLWEIIKA